MKHTKKDQLQMAQDAMETLSWSRQDAFFILVTMALCMASFYQPLRVAGGGMIILFLAIFSMLNPFSAALYLAASQTLADAPGLDFTPAQLSAVGFAFALLLRKRLTALPGATFECLKWIAPFLMFFALKRMVVWNGGPSNQSELLGLSACLMMSSYYREGAKNKWLWFSCLCIGAVIGISGFVLHVAGFEATVQAGMHGVRERLYIGRAANATSIGLVAGLGGMLALWLAVRLRTLRIVPQRWEPRISLFMLVMCWLALLAIFATGSRAGAMGALIVIVSVLTAAFLLPVDSQMQAARKRLLPAILVLMIGGAAVIGLPQTGFMGSMQRMLEISQEQAQQHGVSILVAGRDITWYPALLDFLDSPIFGVMPGQWERTIYGVHNVFISMGKTFGLVGLIVYLIYFAGPTMRVCRMIGLRLALPFVMFLLGIFLIFNSLDFSNYKTFHVYNGIMISLILGQKSASLRNIPDWSYRRNRIRVGDIHGKAHTQGKDEAIYQQNVAK